MRHWTPTRHPPSPLLRANPFVALEPLLWFCEPSTLKGRKRRGGADKNLVVALSWHPAGQWHKRSDWKYKSLLPISCFDNYAGRQLNQRNLCWDGHLISCFHIGLSRCSFWCHKKHTESWGLGFNLNMCFAEFATRQPSWQCRVRTKHWITISPSRLL